MRQSTTSTRDSGPCGAADHEDCGIGGAHTIDFDKNTDHLLVRPGHEVRHDAAEVASWEEFGTQEGDEGVLSLRERLSTDRFAAWAVRSLFYDDLDDEMVIRELLRVPEGEWLHYIDYNHGHSGLPTWTWDRECYVYVDDEQGYEHLYRVNVTAGERARVTPVVDLIGDLRASLEDLETRIQRSSSEDETAHWTQERELLQNTIRGESSEGRGGAMDVTLIDYAEDEVYSEPGCPDCGNPGF